MILCTLVIILEYAPNVKQGQGIVTGSYKVTFSDTLLQKHLLFRIE